MSSAGSSAFLPDYESTRVLENDTTTDLPQFRQRGDIPRSDETLSVELGRIAAETAKRSALKTNNVNNMRDTSTQSADNYYNNTSQQVKSRKPLQSQGAERTNSLRKEASVRRALSGPQDLTTTSNLSVTGYSDAYQRRTLSDMHAKANDESIASFISSDRPEDATTNITRNTRFSRSRQISQNDNPLFYFPKSRQTSPNSSLNFTGLQTQRSFMLPDLPNITELVSGTRRDGTPIFPRSAKSRSRFTAPNHNSGNTETLTHLRVNSAPLPREEKIINVSLELMGDKVIHLQKENSWLKMKLEENVTRTNTLQTHTRTMEELQRPDSGLGSDDEESPSDKWRVERVELQSTIRTLSERLRRSERQVTVSELTIKAVSEERDALITQVGAAYYSTEELKDENQKLKVKNEKLHAKLAKTRAQIIQASVRDTTDLKPIVRASTDLKPVKAPEIVKATTALKPAEGPKIIMAEGADITELTGLNDEQLLGLREMLENERHSRKSSANVPDKSVRIQSPHTSDAISHNEPRDVSQTSIGSIDSNLLASLESSLISNSHRRSRTKSNEARVPAHTPASLLASRPPRVAALREVFESLPVSLETSLINNSPRRRRRARSNEETISAQKAAAIHDREQMQSTQTSMVTDSTQSEPSRISMANAIPQGSKLNEPLDALPPSFTIPRRHMSDEETLDSLIADLPMLNGENDFVSHDKVKSTACPSRSEERKPVPSRSEARKPVPSRSEERKPILSRSEERKPVSAPVPVSERDIDDTNATMRPSQPPAVALATVMEQLEDEVAQLKKKLDTREMQYKIHDPATSRHMRKKIRARMDKTIEEIEHRSDQIYALYDVLEGQKQAAARAGAEGMDEEQIEETLQSLGIDTADLAERAAIHLKDERAREKRYKMRYPLPEGITGPSRGSSY